MSDTARTTAADFNVNPHVSMRSGPPADLISELDARGLLHQCTDLDGLRAHLNDPANHPRKGYAGFDPTAPSLTIGNLVPIMMLARFKQAGHIPVVLMGGGTGLIGDPSGKSAERQLQTPETVQHNIDRQRPIFESVLGRVDGPGHVIVNNHDWLGGLGYIEVLRDVGKHFSVNAMIQKDSVRERLNNRDQGISYTEFSYMILQSYDFLHLFRERDVSIQFGGSDQWGNITAGTDLIRKCLYFEPLYQEHTRQLVEQGHEPGTKGIATDGSSVPDIRGFGLTVPLITKADGTKFGKTESGAVWLTTDRTSVYQYFQFWLNTSDDDLETFLKTFTFVPTAEIDDLLTEHRADPGRRAAQRRLAQEATTILHGPEAAATAERAGQALFSGDIASLDEQTLREVLAEAPSSDLDRARLDTDSGVALVDLLVETGVAQSKREAREFLQSGSVAVNGTKIDGPDAVESRLTPDHLLHGSIAAIRRGKKTWHVVRCS